MDSEGSKWQGNEIPFHLCKNILLENENRAATMAASEQAPEPLVKLTLKGKGPGHIHGGGDCQKNRHYLNQ